MKKASEIRSEFLRFFKDRDHTVVKSSSLIPRDDPSLLFTNAGMVQFKKCFLGEERRLYVRATSSQKCVRAGGKHNDLENVGYTARHHTFFEMLGNFSFGDYFKKEAIGFAWEFLTDYLKLPHDRLYATIHEGDMAMDLGPDEESRGFWSGYLPNDRILAFPTKDNFWAMGDTGPCGPCSEIIIDQGPQFGCGSPECKPGCNCDRYLELWNLVFMQFDRKSDGTLEPLPRPSIDTGMGLERIAAVVQQVPSNYDIDLFYPIMQKIEDLSSHRYGADKTRDVSIKVIADHSRAAAFLVGDGILPSNEGRGYVLRRVIRRALRHGRFLGLNRPFLYEVAVAVMESMYDAYPELMENRNYITEVIRHEEERFNETLDFGLRLLHQEIERLRGLGKSTIPGELVFKLYDTYGFPTDIVTDFAKSIGFTVDLEKYEQLMGEQRERSRLHWKGSGEYVVEGVYRELVQEIGETKFLGYDTLESEGTILAIIGKGTRWSEASAGDVVEIIVDRTPFYGESGGQVGDRGFIEGPHGRVSVEDTHKLPGDLIVHVGRVVEGTLRVAEKVKLRVDADGRADTARHHTATHVLHAVLRKVLGDHVKQSGSLVAPDRLRFDFTHFRAVTPDELERIEILVNEEIRRNHPVTVTKMSYDEALRSGAIALFEEKYGDVVRVVEISGLSRELCGGTHVTATSDIGAFFIIQELSVAGGVRRIEAVAGSAAIKWVQNQRKLLRTLSDVLKTPLENLHERVVRLLEREKLLEREVEKLKHVLTTATSQDVLSSPERIGNVQVIISEISADDPVVLREVYDRFKERFREKAVLVLGSNTEDKALLLVGVSRDLTKQIHAGNLVRELAGILGGRGGGRPDMAQAGGPRVDKIQDALDHARHLLNQVLGRN